MAQPTWQSQTLEVLAEELPDATCDDLTRIVARLEPVVSDHVLGHTLPLSQQLVASRADAARQASASST